jgi:hypothetical protein
MQAGGLSFAMPSPVAANSKGLLINWDDFMYTVLKQMNLPANTGTYHSTFGGTQVDFDYTIFHLDAGLALSASWSFGLDVRGVNATLVLEDGTTTTFPVGTPVQITVPANADLNHDARVDVSITLSLDSSFHDSWSHTETGGYLYTGGYGRFRVLDDFGKTIAKRQVGPALDQACTPLLPSGDVDPIHCISTTTNTKIDFDPTGFSKPKILGAFDLMP